MSIDPIPSPQKTYPPPMPVRALRQGVNVPQRQGLALGGVALLVLSVPVGFATPSIPVGLPMAVIGAVLVGLNAVWGRRWLDDLLARHPAIEKRVPDWLVVLAAGRGKRPAAE